MEGLTNREKSAYNEGYARGCFEGAKVERRRVKALTKEDSLVWVWIVWGGLSTTVNVSVLLKLFGFMN
jgi:hypothetical protein